MKIKGNLKKNLYYLIVFAIVVIFSVLTIMNSQANNRSYSFPEPDTDYSKISWAEMPIDRDGVPFEIFYRAWDIGQIGVRISNDSVDDNGQMILLIRDSAGQEYRNTYTLDAMRADSEGISWLDVNRHVKAGELQLTIQNNGIEGLRLISYSRDGILDENGNPKFSLNMMINAVSYPKARAYLFSMIWAVAFLILFLYLQGREITYKRLFLVVYIMMGIMGFMVFPPFAEPDSGNHYRRAFAISEGEVLPKLDEDNAIGGSFAWPSTWATGDTVGPSWYEIKNRVDFDVTDKESETYLTYTNIALYSPVCHLIPAIGMKVAGWFTNSMILIEVAGRALNYIAIGIVLFLGVIIIPFGKKFYIWAVTGPFLIKLYTSISPDIMTAALVYLLTAMVMRLRYDPDTRIDVKYLAALYLVPFFLGQFKIVYVAFCVLLFLIPMEKFASRKKYILHASAIASVTAIPALIWFRISSQILREGYSSISTANTRIAMNPGEYIPILLNTFLQKGHEYIGQFFGSILGLGEGINETVVLLYTMFVVTVLGMELQKRKSRNLNNQTVNGADGKMICLFTTAITVVTLLIFTAEYVQWTDPGARIINGVSGRYFFPFIIPAAMLITRCSESGKDTVVATEQDFRIIFGFIAFTLCFVAHLYLGYQL